VTQQSEDFMHYGSSCELFFSSLQDKASGPQATALHWAAIMGHVPIVRLLLKQGASEIANVR